MLLENQVVLGSAHLSVNLCDVDLTGIFSKWLLKYSLSSFSYAVLLISLLQQQLSFSVTAFIIAIPNEIKAFNDRFFK